MPLSTGREAGLSGLISLLLMPIPAVSISPDNDHWSHGLVLVHYSPR